MPFPKRLPAQWLTAAAARLTFVSGVGYVALAYTVSRFLTRPRRRQISKSPADLGMPCEPIQMRTSDGVMLAGWLFEAPEPRGTIALFHGMRHNREQMLSRIAFLQQAGYRCIAIDHRAHGQSGGKRVSFGWYEARDVQTAAKWIAERFPEQAKFAVGFSMGAAAVSFAGPDCGWSKVIVEGVYADLPTAFKRRIGANLPRWFGDLYPAVMWITQKRLRMRVEQIRPVEWLCRFGSTPILAIAGEKDHLAPPADVAALAASTRSSIALMVIPKAGHNDLCETGGDTYRQRILDFLRS